MADVNNILKQMHSHVSTDKGTYGELAVFEICKQFYNKGGILIHSYSYKVDPSLPGNIKKRDADNSLYVENLGSTTEIDVMLVTKYRVFPIEVKAYKANKITLKDDGIYGCYKTDKSPVHQNEMHCRHLYSYLYEALPDGKTDYIVPIVCMVDEATIEDYRSQWQQEYIHLTILDTLKQTIENFNTPLDYQLNLTLVDASLRKGMFSCEKYLPIKY